MKRLLTFSLLTFSLSACITTQESTASKNLVVQRKITVTKQAKLDTALADLNQCRLELHNLYKKRITHKPRTRLPPMELVSTPIVAMSSQPLFGYDPNNHAARKASSIEEFDEQLLIVDRLNCDIDTVSRYLAECGMERDDLEFEYARQQTEQAAAMRAVMEKRAEDLDRNENRGGL